ncbi:hypothetical protein DPMN_145217 [Dreissena polymorpha]|uniref:Uncharacterized protein n=1 Tax=Dreissena polymorpha TaxID=45954 RepID=A0A9D4F695_DREPO|nr:hypothetical protein DPMN_145217 [Dreissena polymorpha]
MVLMPYAARAAPDQPSRSHSLVISYSVRLWDHETLRDIIAYSVAPYKTPRLSRL